MFGQSPRQCSPGEVSIAVELPTNGCPTTRLTAARVSIEISSERSKIVLSVERSASSEVQEATPILQ